MDQQNGVHPYNGISFRLINLEDIMLSEIGQSRKGRYYGSHLHEVPRVMKFRDRKQNGGCQGLGEGGMESYCLMGPDEKDGPR